MGDRRKWKCFIGMHQFTQVGLPQLTRVYDDRVSITKPVKTKVLYIMRCDFCGKMDSKRMKL